MPTSRRATSRRRSARKRTLVKSRKKGKSVQTSRSRRRCARRYRGSKTQPNLHPDRLYLTTHNSGVFPKQKDLDIEDENKQIEIAQGLLKEFEACCATQECVFIEIDNYKGDEKDPNYDPNYKEDPSIYHSPDEVHVSWNSMIEHVQYFVERNTHVVLMLDIQDCKQCSESYEHCKPCGKSKDRVSLYREQIQTQFPSDKVKFRNFFDDNAKMSINAAQFESKRKNDFFLPKVYVESSDPKYHPNPCRLGILGARLLASDV